MDSQELCARTMQFSLRVLRAVEAFPLDISGQTVARQMARSGTSVAANYRAALRAKSRADFINKVTIVLEETDETAFWLELAMLAKLLPESRVTGLHGEAIELTKIFAATRRTARHRQS